MNKLKIKRIVTSTFLWAVMVSFVMSNVCMELSVFAQADEDEPSADIIKPPRKFKKLPQNAKVTFNLEDAELVDLVKLISNMTGKRFILPSKSKSIKATVLAPTKITVREAYAVFLSILETNDLTVVPAGKFLKIEAAKGVQGEPISTRVGASAPNNDEFVTRLYRVKNVSAEDVSKLISRFKTKNGDITTYAPTNMLVITDRGVNVKRLIKLVRIVDVPRAGEQVWIEPIHHADAAEILEQLEEIFTIGDSSSGSSKSKSKRSKSDTIGKREGEARISKIISEERTNSLIIMATEPAYVRVLEMIRVLDVPLEGGGHVHVRYIQNGDATEIASTLQNLIGKKSSSSSRRRSKSTAPDPLSDLFEGEIGITAHKPTNALVITASYHDYAALESVLEELDAPRRQVFIEAVVMELTVDKQTNLGLGFHTGIPNVPTEGSLSILGFNAMRSIGVDQNSLTGLALGMRGPEVQESQQLIGFSIPGFGVMLNAIAKSGDVNILSTPHIIAMDNIQAEISVGRNVPLQTSGIAGGLGALAGLSGQQGTAGLGSLAALGGAGAVPRQNVGTTIRVTPHVNDANQIRMEIEQEISEAQAPVGTLGVVPVSQRTAKTEVMADDQQTIVIGGMMKDTVVVSEDKIPILGDIPLLGMLFRNKEKRTEKVNLLMFLTPYIIRSPADLRAIFERKMRERQDFLDRFFVFNDNDYEPPIDYSRTRGLVSEIINEVEEIEEQQELSEQARLAPPPDHKPRNPVGSYLEDEESDEEEGETEIIEPDSVRNQSRSRSYESDDSEPANFDNDSPRDEVDIPEPQEQSEPQEEVVGEEIQESDE